MNIRTSKFIKGTFTAALASTGMYLASKGCNVGELTEFLIMGAFSVVAGLIHYGSRVAAEKGFPEV